jgi:site-specific DNA recombinase
MERLTTAYQEDLMSLDDLRHRMTGLRKREQASAELTAVESQLVNRAGYLRLAERVTSFLARLHETAKTLDVAERQRIVRLLDPVGCDKDFRAPYPPAIRQLRSRHP